jgi:hypothetical protein
MVLFGVGFWLDRRADPGAWRLSSLPFRRKPREEAVSVSQIPHDRFWSIIGETTPYGAEADKQLDALKAELSKLTPTEIAGFASTFDQIMATSYSWGLWGAAYVIHGGAGDDGFEYFRAWLISKGQNAFEAASIDPDGVGDMIAPDSTGPMEFEEFAYVAGEVWATKTGKEASQIPHVADVIYTRGEPEGEPFEETEGYLSHHYPKLWKRFGHNPAQ